MKKKILIIDDSADVRTLVVELLKLEYDVLAVESWAESLNYVYREKIDLMLLDFNMPGFKGDKVAQLFRNSSPDYPLKIVLFSSIDEADLKKIARETGVTGYIQKTFEKQLLLMRIKRFIDM